MEKDTLKKAYDKLCNELQKDTLNYMQLNYPDLLEVYNLGNCDAKFEIIEKINKVRKTPMGSTIDEVYICALRYFEHNNLESLEKMYLRYTNKGRTRS